MGGREEKHALGKMRMTNDEGSRIKDQGSRITAAWLGSCRNPSASVPSVDSGVFIRILGKSGSLVLEP
jgi:hypothetical protein